MGLEEIKGDLPEADFGATSSESALDATAGWPRLGNCAAPSSRFIGFEI